LIKRIAVVLSLLFLSHAPFAAVVSDADIRAILADRIDVQHQGVGIVVGVIDPTGRRVVAYGNMAKGGKPVDADTVFEIGSVSKVFTSLLLADMVQRGEVALTDPFSKYLPPNVKMPERGGKKITLVDLSTHTSSRRSSSRAISAPNTNTRTSAADSSGTYSPAGPGRITRRWCGPGFWSRSG
jgi:CubicO group peptidase (beta-lactamase class C family)